MTRLRLDGPQDILWPDIGLFAGICALMEPQRSWFFADSVATLRPSVAAFIVKEWLTIWHKFEAGPPVGAQSHLP